MVWPNNANMKVWIATWDVEGTETGLEVFAEKSLAVEAAIEYAQEMSLLEEEQRPIDEARRRLISTGELNFYDRQCCYSVCEHDVIGRG
jgi:hypothetical protein